MLRVSIIIVNFNGEQYVDKLFRSLKRQTFKDFEIVLVDNAPTDNALRLVQKYKKTLSMKIIKNKKNIGFCLANNKAIRLCKGKYIVFLNNDTYVDPNWLWMLVKKAEASTKTSAVVGSIRYPFTCEMQGGPALYDIYGAALNPAKGRFFYGMGASLFVRRDILYKIGFFDTKLFMYQDDVDLCWRMRLYGCGIVYEPNAICYHLKEPIGTLESNVKMPAWKFYHAHCKNRIRVLVKNYSKLNVMRRIPMAIALIFVRSLVLSLVNKNQQYMLCFTKGVIWNLCNLKDTLEERHKVQRLRRETDNEIAKHMLPYSVELLFIGKLIKLIRTKRRH